METELQKLIDVIPVPSNAERFIIGIDGLSRSGKTTIGNFLYSHYVEKGVPAVLLHLDDYIVERKHRYETGIESWREYYELQWDVERVAEDLLAPLKTVSELSMEVYDETSDQHQAESIHLPVNSLIIIEGVFLQREEWRSYFDFLCYVDSPRDKRFSRENAETQKQLEKFEQRYWKAEVYYLKEFHPAASADYLISN